MADEQTLDLDGIVNEILDERLDPILDKRIGKILDEKLEKRLDELLDQKLSAMIRRERINENIGILERKIEKKVV